MKRCRILPLVFGVLLAASAALNVALFERGRDYYLQLNQARLSPLGLEAFSGEPVAAPDRPRLVFYGDSRAALWPAPAAPGWAVINRGIGAQTTAQVALRFDQHLAPLRPAAVVLQAGINDLKTLPLFPERRTEIVADCIANLRGLIARVQGLGATVIVTTIFPVGEPPLERRLFWSDDIAEAVEVVNADLRALAGGEVLVLDAYALLAGGDGRMQPQYSADELHLNAAGYEALNRALSALLQTVGAA